MIQNTPLAMDQWTYGTQAMVFVGSHHRLRSKIATFPTMTHMAANGPSFPFKTSAELAECERLLLAPELPQRIVLDLGAVSVHKAAVHNEEDFLCTMT